MTSLVNNANKLKYKNILKAFLHDYHNGEIDKYQVISFEDIVDEPSNKKKKTKKIG